MRIAIVRAFCRKDDRGMTEGIVIVGGGFAGFWAALAAKRVAGKCVAVSLVSREPVLPDKRHTGNCGELPASPTTLPADATLSSAAATASTASAKTSERSHVGSDCRRIGSDLVPIETGTRVSGAGKVRVCDNFGSPAIRGCGCFDLHLWSRFVHGSQSPLCGRRPRAERMSRRRNHSC
jgi:hypothetical protein